MFEVTLENHVLLSLFIISVAFLIAQIITHPDEAPTREQPTASPAKTAQTH